MSMEFRCTLVFLCFAIVALAEAAPLPGASSNTAHILANLSTHLGQMNGSLSDVYFMPECAEGQLERQQTRIEMVENYTFPVSIVTAYFAIRDQKKHTHAEFDIWMPNFLSKIENTPVFVFTSPDQLPSLLAIRKRCPYPGPTIFITFADQWSLPWMHRPVPEPLNSSNKVHSYATWKAAYDAQLPMDPLKHYGHSPSLYAVWNSKPWMLATVSRYNPFSSRYLLWVDVGMFREADLPFRNWPSLDVLEQALSTPGDLGSQRLLSNARTAITSERIQQFKEDDGTIHWPHYIAAGLFGGPPHLNGWFHKEFERLHDKYYQLGFFIGREEPIIAAVVMGHPEKFAFVPGYKAEDQCGANAWFYVLNWLAAQGEKLPNCPDFPAVKLA